MDRRLFLASLALLPAAPAHAVDADELSLVPLPPGVDANVAPGLSWFGSGPAAIEIFDYNCPYCRKAFQSLDAMVAKKKLRLGLIDSPMLSPGSIQAAKLRQAVLMLYGPEKAFAFHRALYAGKGRIDGDIALNAAQAMGLDVKKLADAANGREIRDRIIAQMDFLDRIGVSSTPSFIIKNRLLSGWPGPEAFALALAT
ncbi:thioredoxin domain-containing protein [Rhodoblastus sp.]|uniref:DsbA family protein n=1 Tax=Rhodoblastus sp. TaxID=1962975 RepID=UPI002637D4D6|nr:thioredoxin domain-containing protein [Rhodoblastus sp.]